MGLMLLQWGKEEIIPKYWGYIDHSKIVSSNESIILKSLSMRCENCGDKNNWRVLEGGEKDLLFIIVPLGGTKKYYKLYCNKCDAFQMIINKVEMDDLIKEGIAVKDTSKKNT
jgi:hypothetical protein